MSFVVAVCQPNACAVSGRSGASPQVYESELFLVWMQDVQLYLKALPKLTSQRLPGIVLAPLCPEAVCALEGEITRVLWRDQIIIWIQTGVPHTHLFPLKTLR
jgi:hypothetical protein